MCLQTKGGSAPAFWWEELTGSKTEAPDSPCGGDKVEDTEDNRRVIHVCFHYLLEGIKNMEAVKSKRRFPVVFMESE